MARIRVIGQEAGGHCRARFVGRRGRARVCWPGPIRCRSGRSTAARAPNIAMLDGPAIITVSVEGSLGSGANRRCTPDRGSSRPPTLGRSCWTCPRSRRPPSGDRPGRLVGAAAAEIRRDCCGQSREDRPIVGRSDQDPPPPGGHGLRRVIARHAGSTVCRSGRISAASAANTVRFDGLAIKIASTGE